MQCPHCPKQFQQPSKLKSHLNVHKPDKPFKCQTCGNQFKTNSAMRRHVRDLHDHVSRFVCTECGRSFNTKINYVIHTKRHSLEFTVHCQHCREGFVTRTEYRRHLDAKHNTTMKYVCDVCGKEISSERYLKEHKKIHEDGYAQRYFRQCPFCMKRFRHLKKHIREFHEGAGNNYVCDSCGKSFRGENSLKVHLMIHKGERPYRCEVCRKMFYSKQYLAVHWRIHTGEKPYECQFCGKCFAQKPPLKVHLRLHSGDKPYNCDVCEEKFISRQRLNMHKRRSHQIVGFRNVNNE